MHKALKTSILAILLTLTVSACSNASIYSLQEEYIGDEAKNMSLLYIDSSINKMETGSLLERISISGNNITQELNAAYNPLMDSKNMGLWYGFTKDGAPSYPTEFVLADKMKNSGLQLAKKILKEKPEITCSYKDKITCDENGLTVLEIIINEQSLINQVSIITPTQNGNVTSTHTIEYELSPRYSQFFKGGLVLS